MSKELEVNIEELEKTLESEKKKKKITSMRNVNIRVSKINNTKKDGFVTIEFEEIKRILECWSEEKEFEYFTIEHNEDVENIHYHIVLKFNSPTRFDTIKNKFMYGNIEKSKSVKNSVQYLVHLNSPEKYQHEWESVVTNSSELNKYMLRSSVSEELDIEKYIEDIVRGDLKEFEYTDKIPASIYTKNSSRIEKAFKYYYDKISKDSNRNIEVEFFYGLGGTGKTLCAKTLCEFANESCCISSSSNDPLQDYKGEDVLILDDMRDTSFSFDDLLKILDNNTNSSIKSRYRNKHFIGKRIIITSNVKLENWYNEDYNIINEDLNQLYRRIKTKVEFTREELVIRTYNKIEKSYEYLRSSANIFSLQEEKEVSNDRDVTSERYRLFGM